MNIKKVDDKPMVIHTKEKTKLHVKTAPETKLKGRNVLTVDRSPKIVGAVKETGTDKNDRRKPDMKVRTKGEAGKAADKDKKTSTSGENMRGNDRTASGKRSASGNAKSSAKEAVNKSVQKENSMYTQYRQTKQDREKAIGKKSDTVDSLASIGAKTALDQMEGGDEVYESYMVMDSLSKPVAGAAQAGRDLYRRQAAKRAEQRIKKVNSSKKVRARTIKETAQKTVKDTAKKAAKENGKAAAKETAKTTAKVTAATAGTAAGTAATGAGGVVIGAAAGEAAGRKMDKQDIKNSTRNRMIQLFLSKLRQEDNQDSIVKALKDIAVMRFSIMVKYIVRYVGLFLLGLFALVALLALPIIAVIAVIYNSPFAIFFPSISSGDTTQDVLSAYVAEFNADVEAELNSYTGYDKSEEIYVNFGGEGVPDNYCDILAVYMVKYGNGDTATDMTDKAKQNLKAVFDDMCGYTITSRTDTDTDNEGNTTTTTVKEVNVELKTYQDMVSVYGFNAEEQDMLAELMKPENLAILGYSGSGGGGQTISPEQYQAIVDAVSDANGKKVVEFALSKVGYPYSQALRDSGTHFDCSSLAYYAWRHAGVNISYEGSNTAAYEGKLCYDNNWLVHYDEMQPGDLIFYSYERNGSFMNISHVAIYVGDGMVVEAANTRIGVVYRPVQGKNSIVMIGRPR